MHANTENTRGDEIIHNINTTLIERFVSLHSHLQGNKGQSKQANKNEAVENDLFHFHTSNSPQMKTRLV